MDHVYVQCATTISKIKEINPTLGDHVLVLLKLEQKNKLRNFLVRRDWRHYNDARLVSTMSTIQWELGIAQVQPFWNSFEAKLIAVVDELAPMVQWSNGPVHQQFSKNNVCLVGCRI